MELVYLWVEKYKNIEKQGFNFSPRFECKFYDEYDEEGKLKDDCKLEITENKEYVNIFPENINITAIVGENGSGKSSIFEILLKIRIPEEKKYNNCFFVFKVNSKYYIYSKKSIKSSVELIQEVPHKLLQFSQLNVYHKQSIIDTYPIQANNLKLQFGKYEFEKRQIEVLLKYQNLLKVINDKYYFDNIKIEVNYIKKIYIDDYNFIDNNLKDFIRTSYQTVNQKKLLSVSILHNMLIGLLKYIINQRKNINVEDYKLFNSFIDLFYSFNKSEKIFEQYNKCIDELIELIDIESIKYNLEVIKALISFVDIHIKELNVEVSQPDILMKKSMHIFNLNLGSDFEKDLEEFNFVKISILNRKTGVSYPELSDGERKMLFISIDLIYATVDNNFGNNQIVILDEVDAFLHPNWLKEFNSIIFTLVQEIKKQSSMNIHILLATHSPFLLSDLPKENIIFLKNGKQVYLDIQTFGANIHTLLSHGFFMKDGLMGEFAKGKIENIRKFYNKVIKYKENEKVKDGYKCFYEKKQEEFWHIQKIIGEHFLQTIVKNQLEEIELILLGKKEAIDNEIARLQALKESFKDD